MDAECLRDFPPLEKLGRVGERKTPVTGSVLGRCGSSGGRCQMCPMTAGPSAVSETASAVVWALAIGYRALALGRAE